MPRAKYEMGEIGPKRSFSWVMLISNHAHIHRSYDTEGLA